ncbi:hypothetical protein TVNIR_3639 [Thioalkalivibrio nitratireducens DSM 14787]|uniref:Uncharacterized protein n=1 Tax=Thioalkalivibrio nitratireducens (strain DSM 14787 / UNIQEM 213 / ALEN2) TaxID=1255043 RepID=L0E0A6_THIND|nr:hypothetical protein TVNIR_3639 [Thioalkalivibrio nitratireducens DSM 14787]
MMYGRSPPARGTGTGDPLRPNPKARFVPAMVWRPDCP